MQAGCNKQWIFLFENPLLHKFLSLPPKIELPKYWEYCSPSSPLLACMCHFSWCESKPKQSAVSRNLRRHICIITQILTTPKFSPNFSVWCFNPSSILCKIASILSGSKPSLHINSMPQVSNYIHQLLFILRNFWTLYTKTSSISFTLST